MKTLFSTLLFISAFSLSFAQVNEFEVHENGLIYDSTTVNQLKHIVDSLNLKFKACEITETFYAKPQTKVLIINIESGNIKQAADDLENQISLKQLKEKYPSASVSEPRLVIAYPYIDYEGNEVLKISSKTISENYGETIDIDKDSDIITAFKKGDWIIDYYNGSDYRNEHVTAFYLLEDFKKSKLKDIYAEMIQYSDCMIDTTSTKFIKNGDPMYDLEGTSDYSKLNISEKKELLNTLRSRKVFGTCSMDPSPRIHALNIAMLSAETVNWEVFLKAHLDVMNDRFDRVSDGSYAWAGRKTYLKELEVLDINTIDLLLGVTLRIDKAHKNHYYGDIGRLGRAISESQNRTVFEKTILNMLKDNELDDYNRYLMYCLYDNYLYHLNNDEDKKTREQNFKNVKTQLEKIKKLLPQYLVDNS